MSYQKKYWLDYKSLKVGDTKTYTLELWQNSSESLTAEEIKGGQSPFLLEMPTLQHKFQVVRGRGATINLLSDTDMKFFEGLKHINPKEFKVYHKVDGVVNWVGYLNSDMYSEPYDISSNYIISTTANDGFSLMDRYRFLEDDGSQYYGIDSVFNIIKMCLRKVGLDYNDLRISLATTISGTSSGNDTILGISCINFANFYDEDGTAMTLREVVESVLAPYGAFIFQDGGSIYITDVHTLAKGGSITFKSFDTSTTYPYIGDVVVPIERDIYDVKYFGTGHSITRSGGTNMQRVVYSPFPRKTIINETINSPNEFEFVPLLYVEKISTNGYKYMFRSMMSHPYWEYNPDSGSSFEESYGIAGLRETIRSTYFRVPTSTLNVKALESKFGGIQLSIKANQMQRMIDINMPWVEKQVKTSTGVSILVTAKMLLALNDNPYDEYSKPGYVTYYHGIKYRAIIGNYEYDSVDNVWKTETSHNNYWRSLNEIVANEWIDMGINGNGLLIPINMYDSELLTGEFTFELWTNTAIAIKGGGESFNSPALKETWIKDISMRLVNNDGSEISDSDIQYTGQLNKLFAEEGKEIKLTTGTAIGYTDLAKIMKPGGGTYLPVNLWERAGQTFNIEELLLNSLCSNYRDNFITLNSVRLKNEFSILSVFTDTTFLEHNPKMMIKSSVIDYANYTHDVTLEEISEDELTIIKE